MSSKKQKKEQLKTSSPKIQNNRTGVPFYKNIYFVLVGILLITYIAYIPSLKNGFTNWDDNVYIAENDLIKDFSAKGIKKIFLLENHVSLNYHPITILSLALDYKIDGFNPKTYHVTNLLFHLLNTALVFWFIYLLSNKKLIVAAIVSLFFGIHPMHVESVAWIAERKDVLYTFFFMASLVMYLKYIESIGKKKVLLYCLIVLLYLLSLLSKAMAVVLPIVFILIDYYKGRNLDKSLVIEKIPFFVLSVCFGLLASNIQSEGAAIAKFDTFTTIQRLAFASYGMVNYLYNFFVPINLSCFYPYPNLVGENLPIIFYICPFIILAILILVYLSIKKNKDVVFGFLFFCVTIVLVLQFISVGQVIMADRYSYVPYIGLLFPIAMQFDWLQNQSGNKLKVIKQFSVLLILISSILCVWLTYNRTKVWKNSDTLWTDAISKYPRAEAPYRNRGSYLINKEAHDKGQKQVGVMEIDRALSDFTISINISPTSAKVFTNRANVYGLKGRFDLALADYSSAIALDNTDEQTFYNRAVTYSMMKQYDKAIEDYNTAIAMKSDFTDAIKSRAYCYVDSKNYDNAIADLNAIVVIDSTNPINYFYRGVAYFNSGNAEKALEDNTKAIELNSNYRDAYFNRSVIYNTLGKYKNALEDALKAQSLGYGVSPEYIQQLQKKQ